MAFSFSNAEKQQKTENEPVKEPKKASTQKKPPKTTIKRNKSMNNGYQEEN